VIRKANYMLKKGYKFSQGKFVGITVKLWTCVPYFIIRA